MAYVTVFTVPIGDNSMAIFGSELKNQTFN